MVTFVDAVKICALRKPLNFRDRAPRSEFWWYCLALFIAGIIVNILALIPILGWILYCIFTIFSFITSLSASVRRLHDLNRTGWWVAAPYGSLVIGSIIALIGLSASSESLMAAGSGVILIGALLCFLLLIFYVMPGTRGPNRFGPATILEQATVQIPAATAPQAAPSTAAQPESPKEIPGADGDFTKIGQ